MLLLSPFVITNSPSAVEKIKVIKPKKPFRIITSRIIKIKVQTDIFLMELGVNNLINFFEIIIAASPPSPAAKSIIRVPIKKVS